MIDAERLRRLLEYDPVTGVFRWLVSPGRRVRAGAVAGHVNSQGYRQIQIDGRRYLAHRLAWLYVTGEWPSDKVDHRNTIPGDDRWENLREATHAENCWNYSRPQTNTSGVKGVSWHRAAGKWRAQIGVNGRRVHLGHFLDINEAASAYAAASSKYHGDFGRQA